MKITIDKKEMMVKDPNMNIVDIAKENGITITAPCYRNKKKHGCCKACVIEADGEQKYACGTKPHDGMDITYDREDLKQIRDERLAKYADAIKSGDTSANTCGGTDPTKEIKSDSGCGCSSSCCS